MAQTQHTSQEYLTASETAALLRLQPQTLALWRMTGRGPRFIRVGGGPRGAVRYQRAEINAWAASRTFASTTEADAAVAGRP